MKYTLEMELDLPRERAAELFADPDNMTHWQPQLKSREQIAGSPGQVGAKARLIYDMGGKDGTEMIETITHADLPNEVAGTYDVGGCSNAMRNRFEDLGDGRTRWICDSEFSFDGFMMKLMGMLMPGAFRKQSWKFMEQFKAFAEGQGR